MSDPAPRLRGRGALLLLPFLLAACVAGTKPYTGSGPANLTVAPADVTRHLFRRTETDFSVFPEEARCKWVYAGTIAPGTGPQRYALPVGKRVSISLFFTDHYGRGTEMSRISQVLTVRPGAQYRIAMAYDGKAPDFTISENGRALDLPSHPADCGG
ncbi:MAG: hypothetical protein WBB85_01000 [Albidovulum sp.]|uniref:hypothetical protein n=1 Tax=Albidovulum sp. TaxID=1872424 RepID=UPI003C936A39